MTDIKQLLDRYWEGETTLEEEANIRQYFAVGSVAPEYDHLTGLFVYQTILAQQGSRTEVPAARHTDVEGAGGGASIVPMPAMRWLVRVAAVASILLAAVWLMRPADQGDDSLAQVVLLDEEAEAAAALDATREALAFLSGTLDRNTRTIRRHVKQAEKADIFR
jgi:hypothetical protein